jgi:hypothetical protein
MQKKAPNMSPPLSPRVPAMARLFLKIGESNDTRLILLKAADLSSLNVFSEDRTQEDNTMTDACEQTATITEPLATDAASQLVKVNKYALSLLTGAQKVLFDEMMFAGNEFLDRAVAETGIFNEFLAKLAEAHSVKDLGAMYRECTKHQLDFMRRDTERLLKHSGRVIDNTSKLAETWRQN